MMPDGKYVHDAAYSRRATLPVSCSDAGSRGQGLSGAGFEGHSSGSGLRV